MKQRFLPFALLTFLSIVFLSSTALCAQNKKHTEGQNSTKLAEIFDSINVQELQKKILLLEQNLKECKERKKVYPPQTIEEQELQQKYIIRSETLHTITTISIMTLVCLTLICIWNITSRSAYKRKNDRLRILEKMVDTNQMNPIYFEKLFLNEGIQNLLSKQGKWVLIGSISLLILSFFTLFLTRDMRLGLTLMFVVVIATVGFFLYEAYGKKQKQ